MSSPLDGVDLDDPCAVVAALRKAEIRLAAGASVIRVRFGNDDVQFAAADRGRLRQLIADKAAECEAKQSGRKSRRRAFGVGFR